MSIHIDDTRVPGHYHGYTYLITFTRPTDGRIFYYVGQKLGSTVNKRYSGSGYRINQMYKKYGRGNNTRLTLLSWAYDQAELNFHEQMFILSATLEYDKDCLNLNYGGAAGRVHPLVIKRKIEAFARRPRELEEERHRKIKETLHRSPDILLNRNKRISEANMGHKTSLEARLKMAAAKKAAPEVTCPYCGTCGKGGIMVRWHFDNCTKSPSGGANRTGDNYVSCECPHCNTYCGTPQMKRYHFDNCKFLPKG